MKNLLSIAAVAALVAAHSHDSFSYGYRKYPRGLPGDKQSLNTHMHAAAPHHLYARAAEGTQPQAQPVEAIQQTQVQAVQPCNQGVQVAAVQPCQAAQPQIQAVQPHYQTVQVAAVQPCQQQGLQVAAVQPCQQQGVQVAAVQPCQQQAVQVAAVQPCQQQAVQVAAVQPCQQQAVQVAAVQPCQPQAVQVAAVQPIQQPAFQVAAVRPVQIAAAAQQQPAYYQPAYQPYPYDYSGQDDGMVGNYNSFGDSLAGACGRFVRNIACPWSFFAGESEKCPDLPTFGFGTSQPQAQPQPYYYTQYQQPAYQPDPSAGQYLTMVPVTNGQAQLSTVHAALVPNYGMANGYVAC